MFGERKIDNNKPNEELKNSNRKKSKKGQQKRVTTTIKNEETKHVNNIDLAIRVRSYESLNFLIASVINFKSLAILLANIKRINPRIFTACGSFWHYPPDSSSRFGLSTRPARPAIRPAPLRPCAPFGPERGMNGPHAQII